MAADVEQAYDVVLMLVKQQHITGKMAFAHSLQGAVELVISHGARERLGRDRSFVLVERLDCIGDFGEFGFQ